MKVYGIYWTREGLQPGERIEAHEVDWMLDADHQEAVMAFEEREDKYWPSLLFEAEVTHLKLLQEGECPL